MSYYSDNVKQFILDTKDCDMSNLYYFFEKYLKNAKKILDIGFGSGRDSLYFAKKYDVTSIDPTKEFCDYAVKIGLKNILNIKAQEIDMIDTFDGIWACASLLHVPYNELKDTFKKCGTALHKDGIIYCSFKYGDFEGIRNDRYYVDMNKDRFNEVIKDTGLKIVEIKITEDVRKDRNDKWFNCILVKE